MNSNEIKQKTALATKWSTITEIAAKCVAPITNMVLARLLAPEEFGVVATVTMVVSFADMFTDAGFQKYLMQHDFADPKELNEHTNVAFWANFTVSLLLWCLIAVFSEPIATLVGNPGLGNVMTIAALSLPLTSFSSIQMARFRREFDFKLLFYIRLISACVPFVITIPLALVLRNYWALVIGTLVSNLVNAVLLTVRSEWKPKLYFKFSILKEMFSYSWWVLMESITSWLTSYIDTFIVGLFLTQYYVGIYKTAMSTVNQIVGLITTATSAPLFVAMSRLKNDHNELLNTYNNFIMGISMFLIPLGVGIFLYRDLVTEILLGSQWTEAADFLGLWGLTSSIVLVLGTYCNGLYNAKGKTYLSFISQILHLAVLMPVLLWAAPKGFETLFIARCAARLELILVQMIIMRFCMKVPVLAQLRGLLPAVVSTGIMVIVSLGLQRLDSSVLWQICSVVICICIYFAVCFLFFRKQLVSALNIFGIKKK